MLNTNLYEPSTDNVISAVQIIDLESVSTVVPEQSDETL